jgi:hypothetical protein
MTQIDVSLVLREIRTVVREEVLRAMNEADQMLLAQDRTDHDDDDGDQCSPAIS